MAGFSAPAEAQPAGAPLASAGANAAPVEWAPRPMSLASLDQGLAVEASLAPFVSAPVPNAAELTASSVAPVSAVEWPRASALRIRTAELSLASERSLAAFAEMAPASPAQPSAVIISNATPVSSQANLRLPGFETQVDAAAPAVAPANSLAHPAQPAAAESRSTACEIPSPKLQLPKFIPAGANNETETIPLVPRPVSYEAPAAEFRPQPIPAAPPTALPQFTAETRPELAVTDFDRSYPPAAAPAPGDVQADLSPIAQLPAKPQAIDAECEVSSVPSPSFVPVEFHVQRASAWSRWTPGWNWPVIDTLLPDFQMEVVEDRNEEPLVVAPEPKPASNPAEVFTMPEAKRISRKPVWDYAFKIAACLVMATVLWFGGHAINLGSQSLMANRALTPAEAADAGAVASAGGAAVPATPAPPSGFWARSRVAMANRATVEVADNFKNGMEAWGSSAHSWAPGWARDPSGYVRPGTLQLLQPTKSFRDYRMEFFGQIESKGIGWVMRGQDKENYYAMKFQVVQDGLRPVIAMVHYPVVAGKKGRRVETPLDVMIHHNEPFRVAVDVVGNRFTASIEGQKIDSWVDEAPASGAAGLFAEANEKARIYWMKVTKNDDWIGHICSYLSGGSSDVAELWGPGIPGGNPLPGQPQRVPDMMVAEMDSFNFEKMSKVGRNKIWKS